MNDINDKQLSRKDMARLKFLNAGVPHYLIDVALNLCEQIAQSSGRTVPDAVDDVIKAMHETKFTSMTETKTTRIEVINNPNNVLDTLTIRGKNLEHNHQDGFITLFDRDDNRRTVGIFPIGVTMIFHAE